MVPAAQRGHSIEYLTRLRSIHKFSADFLYDHALKKCLTDIKYIVRYWPGFGDLMGDS